MEDEVLKSRTPSILSKSYTDGVKRLSGKREDQSYDFEISAEVLKSREKSWTMLFEKFSKARPGDKELNIFPIMPVDESEEFDILEDRYPIRKTKAQLEYWIKTGRAPCQAMELESSDTEDSISISESETEYMAESQRSSTAVNEKLTESCVENLFPQDSSSLSSVDTATYIRNSAKTTTKKNQEDRPKPNPPLVDNNRIIRSINAAVPMVLLTRLKEIPVRTKIRDENAQKVKNLKNVRACEVTSESKESSIESLKIANRDRIDKPQKDRPDASSAGGMALTNNKSQFNHRRKLYTKSDVVFDIFSPTVRNIQQIGPDRKSIHPALATPTSTVRKNKRCSYGPKFLIIPRALAKRRRLESAINKSYAKEKLARNRTILSKSELANNFYGGLGGSEGVTPLVEKNADNLADDEEGEGKIAEKEVSTNELTENWKEAYDDTAGGSSSSLSSNDVSQIINEELVKSSEVRKRNLTKKSNVVDFWKVRSEADTVDQGSVSKTRHDAVSETVEARMKSVLSIKKNLYATDLRSFADSDSNSRSNSDTIGFEKAKESRTSWMKRSVDSLSIDELIPIVILHDFLNPKPCCPEPEIENIEIWRQKHKRLKKEVNNAKNVAAERLARIETAFRSKEAKNHQPETTTDLASRSFNVFSRNFESSSSKIRTAEKDSNISAENWPETNSETLSKITDKWKAFFVSSSEDDDDILKVLSQPARRKSGRQNNGGTNNRSKLTNGFTESNTRTDHNCYEIVLSSSEDEQTVVKKKARASMPKKAKRRYTTRSERKNSSAETAPNSIPEDEEDDGKDVSGVAKTRKMKSKRSDESEVQDLLGSAKTASSAASKTEIFGDDSRSSIEKVKKPGITGTGPTNDSERDSELNRKIERTLDFAQNHREDFCTEISKLSGEKFEDKITSAGVYGVDEPLDDNEAMITITTNNAGNNCLDKISKSVPTDENSVDVTSETVSNDRKKRRRRRRSRDTTIVYRTKEFWETDSDNA